MDLCSDGHSEICYDERTCPLCDERSELQGQIDELEKENNTLKDYIEVLKSERE